MAQKSSPYSIRLGYNKDWNNYFFAKSKKEQVDYLKKDKLIRDYLNFHFSDIDQLKIEYTKNSIFIYLHMPGISFLIEENKEKLNMVAKGVHTVFNDSSINVQVNLIEVKRIYSQAQSIANIIAKQLKMRLPSRQILKNVLIKLPFEKEVKGVKIEIKGRLDESDIARERKETYGKMPISTIDSNVDVGRNKAILSSGTIGIKVLVYKGRFWKKKNKHNVDT